jgi:hypothetical protein
MSITSTKGVTAGDIRRMLDLISEVCRSSASVPLRMTLVLRRLTEMTHSQVGIVARVRREAHKPIQLDALIDQGFANDRARAAALDASLMANYRNEPLEEAFDRLLASDVRSRAARTVRRQDVLPDDEVWYRSGDVADARKPAGIDDCIYSIFPLPQTGHYACLALHKRWGDKSRFSQRDRQIADFAWQSLGFLHEQPLAATRIARPGELPAELTTVFELLRSGDPTRGAAARLGMTAAEFRSCVNRIYRYYDVPNRLGLLAKLASTEPA